MARQSAFSCTYCSHSLLRNESIRFGFDSSFVERCTRANAECRRWLRRLHAMPGRSESSIEELERLDAVASDSDPRFLVLAAFMNSVTHIPPWFRRCRQKDFVVSLARVNPSEAAICRSIRSVTRAEELGVKRIPETKWSTDPWKKDKYADGRMVSRLYHRTIMRVASCFLRQISAKHGACINTPRQIAGEKLGSILLGWQWHILDCCPIAVGFWLWRLQSATRFSHLVEYGPTACAQTLGCVAFGPSSSQLCYAIERSRLHTCIVVSHRCRKLWQETGQAFPALNILDEWAHRSGTLITPHQSCLNFKGAETDVAFFRLDASSLIARVACLGNAVLDDCRSGSVSVMASLRRHQRSATVD